MPIYVNLVFYDASDANLEIHILIWEIYFCLPIEWFYISGLLALDDSHYKDIGQ